jgi:DNA-binding protein HU-beta
MKGGGKTMNKAQLIDEIAKKTKQSKAQVKLILDSFLSTVEAVLKKGDKLALPGFGTWYVAKRKARKGRNPKTGETINIPGGKVPRFKPGNKLKAAVK